MPGRRPIFVSLISGTYYAMRDFLYKQTIEPKAPEIRKSKDTKDTSKVEEEKKPW